MKKYKKLLTLCVWIAALLIGGLPLAAEAPAVDKTEVPLTDPSKPAVVKTRVMVGNIIVTGYDGKSILVEAREVERKKGEKELESMDVKIRLKYGERKKEKNDKAKGMYRISPRGTGLNITEENNNVHITTGSAGKPIELTLKVPFKTSLKLKGHGPGKLVVKNVEGELDVSHLGGPVTLKNVSGTVLAHTLGGDINVTFDKVDTGNPMSFSSMGGDIDVTFPANAAFNLAMESEHGEIFSDYKLKTRPAPDAVKVKRDKGKFAVKFNKAVHAQLNGGGKDVKFKTMAGDIYIRKAK